jgi:hypothetical protein
MDEPIGSHEDLIAALKAAAARGDTLDGPPEVIACAGPPACLLEGDDAVAAAQAGCQWCRRITVGENGDISETGPGHA